MPMPVARPMANRCCLAIKNSFSNKKRASQSLSFYHFLQKPGLKAPLFMRGMKSPLPAGRQNRTLAHIERVCYTGRNLPVGTALSQSGQPGTVRRWAGAVRENIVFPRLGNATMDERIGICLRSPDL